MSCCQVCSYGVMSDTNVCCVKICDCCSSVPICISDSMNCFSGKIGKCIIECTPPCTLKAKKFWFTIDIVFLTIGVLLLGCFSWIFIPTTYIPTYVGIGLVIGGIIPWIVYGFYRLGLRFLKCYQRYQKQYHEYKNIDDIENQSINQLLLDDETSSVNQTMTMIDI